MVFLFLDLWGVTYGFGLDLCSYMSCRQVAPAYRMLPPMVCFELATAGCAKEAWRSENIKQRASTTSTDSTQIQPLRSLNMLRYHLPASHRTHSMPAQKGPSNACAGSVLSLPRCKSHKLPGRTFLAIARLSLPLQVRARGL